MNSEWHAFLKGVGAVFDGDRVAGFGHPDAELHVVGSTNLIADLSQFGTIAISGEEAEGFLQGQFSNDVREVDDSHSQLSAYCSPKGRALASFRLYRREETWFMRLPAETVAATVKRLRMFVLMSKVVLEDLSDTVVGLGCCGPEAAQILARACGSVPDAVDAVVHSGRLSILRVPGTRPRFEVYGAVSAATDLWTQLSANATPVGSRVWSLLDIQAGIPTILTATADTFVPQMVNLHAVDGISFRKGCYPGQEVVARTQYLGKLKRRMYRVHIAADPRPEAGDNVYPAGNAGEQAVGKIVDAQPSPRGGYEALAVIQTSDAAKELHVHAPDGPALTFLDLPYSVEVEEK